MGDSTIVGVDEPQPVDPGFDPMTYPNPSMSNTRLKYSLNATEDVNVRIFDAAGRAVDYFEINNQGPGTHEVDIKSEFFKPGTYYINLSTKHGSESTIFIKRK